MLAETQRWLIGWNSFCIVHLTVGASLQILLLLVVRLLWDWTRVAKWSWHIVIIYHVVTCVSWISWSVVFKVIGGSTVASWSNHLRLRLCIAKEWLMGQADTFSCLLLWHLIENRVIKRASRNMLPTTAVVMDFTLKGYHSNLQVRASLLQLLDLWLQLTVIDCDVLQLLLSALQLALFLQNRVVELIDLEWQLLVLFEQLLGMPIVLGHLARFKKWVHLQWALMVVGRGLIAQ